jgi:hypothetical protein
MISSKSFPKKYISVDIVYCHSVNSSGGAYRQFKLILLLLSIDVSIFFPNQKSIILAIPSSETIIFSGRISLCKMLFSSKYTNPLIS